MRKNLTLPDRWLCHVIIIKKTDKGYVLTISDDLSGDVEFNIKVTNKIEPDRPYEDKEEIENLFKIPSVDA